MTTDIKIKLFLQLIFLYLRKKKYVTSNRPRFLQKQRRIFSVR
jgi:hypothetical protein